MNPGAVLLVGGFCETIELCRACGARIAAIVEKSDAREISGIPVVGDDSVAPDLPPELKQLPVIVSPDRPALRRRLAEYYRGLGFRLASLVHPTANVSPSAALGDGVLLHVGVNVSANVVLGDGVVANVHANIMHDSRVGAFTTVAPDAVVLGRVTIGQGAYVGANATILPSVAVADGATVGAGAVVTKNVPAGAVVAGNPARPLHR